MSGTNTTHRKRLARMLAEAEHLPYQRARQRVEDAADLGLLPARLDRVGLNAALRTLRETPPPLASSAPAASVVTAAATSSGGRRPWQVTGRVSNEQMREAIEANVRAEERIAAWIAAMAAADPHPVRWKWTDPEDARKDSLTEIDIEYSDGHHEIALPVDLTDRLAGESGNRLAASASAPPDPRALRREDLRQNLLVQTPDNEVLKISEFYERGRVSAQVVYPVPPRTTVRFYTPEQVARWRRPSRAMVGKYERAWGYSR